MRLAHYGPESSLLHDSFKWAYDHCLVNAFDAIIDKMEERNYRNYDGEIIAELYLEGNDVVLSITDNGKTIEFDNYGRPAIRTRNRKKQHGGVGTPGFKGVDCARQFCKRHKGTIVWYSLEDGTRAEIRIPKENLRIDSLLAHNEQIVIEDNNEKLAKIHATLVYKVIEKRAQSWQDKSLEQIYLDDIVYWKGANTPLFEGFGEADFRLSFDKTEIRISIPRSNICIRYYDTEKSEPLIPYTDWTKTKTHVINERINRQIIHTAKTLTVKPVSDKEERLTRLREKLKAHGYRNPDIIISQIGLDEKIADFIIANEIPEKNVGSVYRATKSIGLQNTAFLIKIGVPWQYVSHVGIAYRDHSKKKVLLAIEIMRSKESRVSWKDVGALAQFLKTTEKEKVCKLIDEVDKKGAGIPWGVLEDIAINNELYGEQNLEVAIRIISEVYGKIDWDNVVLLLNVLDSLSEEQIKSALTGDTPIPVEYISKYTSIHKLGGEKLVAQTFQLHRKHHHGNIVWDNIDITAKQISSFGYKNVDRACRLTMAEWGFIPWGSLDRAIENIKSMNDAQAEEWMRTIVEEIPVRTEKGNLPKGIRLKPFKAKFLCFPRNVTTYHEDEFDPATHGIGLFLDDQEVQEEEASGYSINDKHLSGSYGNIFFCVKGDGIIIYNFQNAALRSTSKRFGHRHNDWDKMVILAIEEYARMKGLKKIYFIPSSYYSARWDGFNPNVARHLYSTLPEQFGHKLEVVNDIHTAKKGKPEVFWVKNIESKSDIKSRDNQKQDLKERTKTANHKIGDAYNKIIEENIPLISTLMTDPRNPALLRIPIEWLDIQKERIGEEKIKDFLKAFQKDGHGYVELYYMTATEKESKVSPAVYDRYGVYRPIPKDFEPSKENTISLFTLLKGQEFKISDNPTQAKKDMDRLLTTNLGYLDPKDTQVVPIGLLNDRAGLIRGTIAGLRLLYIARQVKAKKDKQIDEIDEKFVNDTITQLKGLYKAQGVEGFDLKYDDIVNFAAGNINLRMLILKRLIDLLPIIPIDINELREIYKYAAKKFA